MLRRMFGFLFLFLSFLAIGQETPLVEQDITNTVKIFRDSEKNWYPDRPGFQEKFKNLKHGEIKEGYTSDIFWFSLILKNPSSTVSDYVLYFNSTLSGQIDLYEGRDGHFVLTETSGSSLPWYKRSIPATSGAFKIKLRPGEKKQIFIKRKGIHRLDSRIFLAPAKVFNEKEISKRRYVYLYIGAIIALSIYNFFLFLYSKDVVYLLYCCFSISILLLSLGLQGFLDYFWPSMDSTPSHYLMICSSLATFFSLLFTKRYLEVSTFAPPLNRFFHFGMISALVHIILFLSPVHSFLAVIMGNTIDITILYSLLLMLATGIQTHRKGCPMARFYLTSWAFIFLAAFIWYGMYFGLFSRNDFTIVVFSWGNVGEMMTIALGLAFKISILDHGKKSAELRAIGKERYERLVRVLVHDIGNPMSLITSYSNVMANEKCDDQEKWDKMARASNSIMDILTKVKLQQEGDNATENIELRSVSLREVVEDSLFIFEQKLKEQCLKINLSLKENEDFNVIAEKTILLHDVFNNIISNAIKFSPKGESILIKVSNSRGKVVVDIQDKGIGIPKKMLEDFLRKGEMSSRQGLTGELGCGYGLSLANSYMKIFGGQLQIESVSIDDDPNNCGSKFQLVFNEA